MEEPAAQAITQKWESTPFSQQTHGHRAHAVLPLLQHSPAKSRGGNPRGGGDKHSGPPITRLLFFLQWWRNCTPIAPFPSLLCPMWLFHHH